MRVTQGIGVFFVLSVSLVKENMREFRIRHTKTGPYALFFSLSSCTSALSTKELFKVTIREAE